MSRKYHRLSRQEEKTEWTHSPTMIFAPPSVPGMARLPKPVALSAPPTEASCCGGPSSDADSPSCCGGTATATLDMKAQAYGYSAEDTSAVPQGSNLGLGCGNPIALASLRPGETVLISAVGQALTVSWRPVPWGRPDGSLAWI